MDTSATMAWCFADERTAASLVLLDRVSADGAVVPALWHAEVANVLAQAERRRRIAPAATAEFLALLGELRLDTDDAPPGRATGPVLALAREHGLTAYDATTLDLATRRGLALATRDAELRRAAGAVGVALLDA